MQLKQTRINHFTHSTVGCVVVGEALSHHGDLLIRIAFNQAHAPVNWRRAQVEQITVTSKYSTGFAKSMDHALM